ncbi:hypothetical protein D3C84_1008030 [compost metagenome]
MLIIDAAAPTRVCCNANAQLVAAGRAKVVPVVATIMGISVDISDGDCVQAPITIIRPARTIKPRPIKICTEVLRRWLKHPATRPPTTKAIAYRTNTCAKL